jgi:hypothetical protein
MMTLTLMLITFLLWARHLVAQQDFRDFLDSNQTKELPLEDHLVAVKITTATLVQTSLYLQKIKSTRNAFHTTFALTTFSLFYDLWSYLWK